MKTGVILYVDDGLSDESLTFQGKYLPEELDSRFSSMENIDEIYISVPAGYSGRLDSGVQVLRRTEKDEAAFWKRCFAETGIDHAVRIYCDSPFADPEIIKDMLDVHVKYLAEYTYSENLPQGYACEIFSKELMESIPASSEKMLPLCSVIRSNINQFDVELYYRDPDIRDKRISFRCGSRREKKILENIFNIKGRAPLYSEVRELIESNPDVLYAGPSYAEIEISGRCDLNCIFCYRNTLKGVHGDMDIDVYRKVLSNLNEFNLPYSICLGGSGEPMMHNRFYEILDLSLKEDLLDTLVIETNGIYADSNFKSYLADVRGERIRIIFNINGMDEASYSSIHNKDYFQAVLKNIMSVKEALPDDDRVYVQIMKINETEGFLDSYYDFWEKKKIPIILQKQNTFLSRIEDRRYSDLSPLERTPCWHLQRDVYILSDGQTAFCKQDVDGDYARGSIVSEPLTAIWERGRADFLNNFNKKLSAKPDCGACDEWYTYNL